MGEKYRLKILSIKIPSKMLEDIDMLVASGRFSTRSELIRTAIRELLKKEKVIGD